MTRVYIAVGHGRKPDGTFDPGAVSADGRWNEQSAGDIIVAEAAGVLRAAGVTVKDESFQNDPNFYGTAKEANDWGADFVVSVHHDWSRAPEGAFCHWYSPLGKALADDIYQAIGAAGFPLRPDWHKFRSDLYVLKHTNAPCALVECGKIGSAALDETDELKAMGWAIAAGIADHIGVGLKPQTLPTPTNWNVPGVGAYLGDIRESYAPEQYPIGTTWGTSTTGNQWTQDKVELCMIRTERVTPGRCVQTLYPFGSEDCIYIRKARSGWGPWSKYRPI